jgi:hypothetical protein
MLTPVCWTLFRRGGQSDLVHLYGGQVDVPVPRGGVDAVGRVVLVGVLRGGLGQELVDTLSVWDNVGQCVLNVCKP